MTRRETKAYAADLWQQVLGSASFADPIGVDQALNSVADDLARRKKIWYGFRTVDLVASQEVYSLENTFDLRGASIKISTGGFQVLDLFSMNRAQREGRRYTGLVPGVAAFAVDNGQTLYLVPPAVSGLAEGLELLGFHNPGMFAACLWPGEDDKNPMPAWSHEACALGLAANRAGVYASALKDRADRQEARQVAAELTGRFEAAARRCEGDAHREYARINALGQRSLPRVW